MDTNKLFTIILFIFSQLSSANCAVEFHQVLQDSKSITKRINTYKHQEIKDSKIKVLVWNIFGGKKNHFQDDFESLYPKYDFVLFQEANLNNQLEGHLSSSHYGWEHARSFKWLNTEMGVATGSLISPSKSRKILSVNREVGFTTRKTSLLTTYPIQGSDEELLILNVHALNFRGTKAYQEEIDQIFIELKTHQGPLIVGGDFNTWSKDRLNYLQMKMKELKLSEVPFKEDRTKAPIGDKLELDRIFFRGLSLDYSEVLSKIETSDHLPLVIELTILN